MSGTAVVEEMLADIEEFLGDAGALAEVADLLEDLAALGRVPAPVPNHELAPYLSGSVVGTATGTVVGPSCPADRAPRRPHRGRRVAAGLAAAAVSSLTLTGVAAVANELPTGLQRTVAHFSENYLPFSLPRPAGDPPVSPSGPGADEARQRDVGAGAGAHRPPGRSDRGGPAARPRSATGRNEPSDRTGATGAGGGRATAAATPGTDPVNGQQSDSAGTAPVAAESAGSSPGSSPGTSSGSAAGSQAGGTAAGQGHVRSGRGHVGAGSPTPAPASPGRSGGSHAGVKGQGGSKPSGQPSGKPSGKPSSKPGDKPSGKPGDKPGSKPGGKKPDGSSSSGGDGTGTGSVTQSPGA